MPSRKDNPEHKQWVNPNESESGNQPTPVAKVERIDPLDVQYSLSLAEQAKLIVIPNDVRPNAETLSLAVQLARSARVPLWGINLIPTKTQGLRPYINADGVGFVVARDERGIQAEDSVTTHSPTKDEPWAEVTCTITFKDGTRFTRKGAVKIDKQWDEGNATLKAETKGFRRAGYAAIRGRVGLPMYDEDANRDYRNEEANDGLTELRNSGTSNRPRTIGQFIAVMTKEDYAYLEAQGVDLPLRELDLPNAWKYVLQGRQERQATNGAT